MSTSAPHPDQIFVMPTSSHRVRVPVRRVRLERSHPLRSGLHIAMLLWFVHRAAWFIVSDVWYGLLCYLLPSCRTWTQRVHTLKVCLFLLCWRHRILPHRLMKRWDRETYVYCGGLAFRVKLTAREHEPLAEVFCGKVYTRLASFLPQHGQTIIDVGANIGGYSMMAAQRGARVIAFEAQRDVAQRLRRGVVRNRMVPHTNTARAGTVWAIHAAIGRTLGQGRMAPQPEGFTPGAQMHIQHGQPDPLAQKVYTLDWFREACGYDEGVDILKIDAEGSEYDILAGARETLLVTKRVVMEYHTPLLLQECAQLLSIYDFVLVLNVNPGFINLGIAYFEKREG